MVTASRDGDINFYDTRLGSGDGEFQPVLRNRLAHITDIPKKRKRVDAIALAPKGVTAVEFIPLRPSVLVSAGSADGCIKFWDCRLIKPTATKPGISSQFMACTSNLNAAGRAFGVTSLCLDAHSTRLFACSRDHTYVFHFQTFMIRLYGSIYAYDALKFGSKPLFNLKVPEFRVSSFFVGIEMSPDDTMIASGSSAEAAYLWEPSRPEKPPLRLNSSGAVSVVSWNSNGDQLALCADDHLAVYQIDRLRAAQCRQNEIDIDGQSKYFGTKDVERLVKSPNPRQRRSLPMTQQLATPMLTRRSSGNVRNTTIVEYFEVTRRASEASSSSSSASSRKVNNNDTRENDENQQTENQ